MARPMLTLHDVQISPDSLPQQASDASNTIFLINFRNHRDMYPPFGIMYVADALEKVGFSCRLFHETEEYLEEFVAQVAEERPLFVGFSTITGPQLKPTIEASKRVHELGIPVVAEGIEDRETWDFVCSLGIEKVQGYFLAKPMPPDAFVGFVSQHSEGVVLAA